jgi:hypothetical protein
MLSVALAIAVVAGVFWLFGRSPLLRGLLSLAALLLYLSMAGLWIGICIELPPLKSAVDVARLPWRWTILLAPPLLLAAAVLHRLRRRKTPARLWSLAGERARLTLPQRALVAAALLALWIVGGGVYAGIRERAADRAWAQSFEPMDALLRRYPKTPASKSALELDRLCAPLGIKMPDHRSQVAESALKTLEWVRWRLSGYLSGQLRKATAELDGPPAELRAFLALHDERIAAIKRHLRSADPVVWALDLESQTIAPFGGHRLLHDVLLLDALEAIRRGRNRAACETLKAVWAHTSSVRSRPDVIDQILAHTFDLNLLRALRWIEEGQDPWEARIRALDHKTSLLRAEQREAWRFSRFARRSEGTLRSLYLGSTLFSSTSFEDVLQSQEQERVWAETPFFRYVQGPLESPFLRLGASSHSGWLSESLTELRGQNLCSFDEQAFAAKRLAALPRYDLVARWQASSFMEWRTVRLAALEAELTLQVLQARARRRASKDATWPSGPTSTPSTVCPGLVWRYDVAEDGTASIAPSKNPFTPAEATLTFRMRPRARP